MVEEIIMEYVKLIIDSNLNAVFVKMRGCFLTEAINNLLTRHDDDMLTLLKSMFN